MAGDNSTNTTQSSATSVPNAVAVPVAQPNSGSPWDEDIDLPSEEPGVKPTVIGSLDDSGDESAPVPFSVPKDIEEKIGQKVPAENYIDPDPSKVAAATSTTIPAQIPTNEKTVDTIKPNVGQTQVASNPSAQVGSRPNSGQVPSQNIVANLKAKIENKPQHDEKALSLNSSNDYVAQKIGIDSASPPAEAVPVPAVAPKKTSSFEIVRLIPLFVLVIPLFLLLILSLLTEKGFLSIGVEKIYGAVGLERLWGGLSKDAESSLVRSVVEMRSHPNFKIKGTMTLSIDKSIKSIIVSPLVAIGPDKNIVADSNVLNIVTAAITQGTSNGSSSAYDYTITNSYLDETSSDDPGSGSDTSSSSVYDDVASTGTSASSSAGSSTTTKKQEDYPSYQYQGSTIKDVDVSIASSFGENGNESTLEVKKTSGTYPVLLKNKEDKLWLKSDPYIKYSNRVSNDQWLEYTIPSLLGKKVQSEFFSLKSDAGLSVRGIRLGNEKIGGERAYHYKVSSFEIGNSLSSLGITSDMVQSVSGDIWIGVEDKLIKRAELKILTSPSTAVTQIILKADFIDYDVENRLTAPEDNLVIKATEDDLSVNTDVRRKGDLATIRDALEEYKVDNDKYPETNGIVKLNSPGNILGSRLVPSYLAALPSDPKATEGWYYSYKSDGKTFSLGSRLENETDPEGQSVGSVYLYLLYNK